MIRSSRGLTRLLILSIILFLNGCANLPPLIQDHNGKVGLYLPTAKELETAMVYQEDAKFAIPDGENCILEHNVLNGHVRFLYPNDAYNQMAGWQNMHYLNSWMLPDGRVMALFIGTVNGQHNTEEMVLFHAHSSGISFITLGTGVLYGPAHISEKHILFQQVNSTNPLLRLYSIQQENMSMPVQRSWVLEREAEERQQRAMKIAQQKAEQAAQQQALREREVRARQRAEYAQANRLRVQRQAEEQMVATQQQVAAPHNHMQMIAQVISLQGGAVSVQSSVPEGHQHVAPQAVNLQ